MIYYLTPFCTQKRLGHIHNQYCALVPLSDDYICLMDPDTMFLHPRQQAWVEDIVKIKGNDWDLLGCMTNRIGVNQQLSVGHLKVSHKINNDGWDFTGEHIFLFGETDIKIHIEHAEFLFNEHEYKVEKTDLVAGFLMIFKKSLWNKIKFQEGINFDIKFCEAVRASGGRIGIMKGIYVYHNYRIGKDNIKDKSHLLNRPQ